MVLATPPQHGSTKTIGHRRVVDGTCAATGTWCMELVHGEGLEAREDVPCVVRRLCAWAVPRSRVKRPQVLALALALALGVPLTLGAPLVSSIVLAYSTAPQ